MDRGFIHYAQALRHRQSHVLSSCIADVDFHLEKSRIRFRCKGPKPLRIWITVPLMYTTDHMIHYDMVMGTIFPRRP